MVSTESDGGAMANTSSCSTGLLLLHRHCLGKRLGAVLSAASKHVAKTLYVQLEDDSPSPTLWHDPKHRSPPTPPSSAFRENSRNVWSLYTSAYKLCPSLDIRLLMTNLKSTEVGGLLADKKLDAIMTSAAPLSPATLSEYLQTRFAREATDDARIIDICGPTDVDESDFEDEVAADDDNTWLCHDQVILGGTFDRLHNGHKILLSEAILLCRRRLVIGVTVDELNKNKVLYELIEPFEERIEALRDFLCHVDGTLRYDIVPIHDPFGPSTTDETLQCIVVSTETRKGGEMVNEERAKRGYNELDIHTIRLLAENDNELNEQDKLSSTALRMKTLGRRRRFSIVDSNSPKPCPYVVGLTGGIASGKSSIAERLRDLGAGVIDSDRLAHEAYSVGTNVYNSIVDHFGRELVAADGQIDRKILATKVFGKKEELDWLTGLVWPEVKKMKDAEVKRLSRAGFRVIVVEAALLVESGWHRDVNELWVAIIPRNEAVKRIVERDGGDAEAAEQRIDRQTTNEVRLEYANVVFCTLWDPQYTQIQVERAWSDLQSYLPSIAQS